MQQSNIADHAPTYSGMVFKKHLGQYTVDADGRLIPCTLSSTLHKRLIYPISSSCQHERIVTSSLSPRPTGGPW